MSKREAEVLVDSLWPESGEQGTTGKGIWELTLTAAMVRGSSWSSTRRMKARLKWTSMMRESIMALKQKGR